MTGAPSSGDTSVVSRRKLMKAAITLAGAAAGVAAFAPRLAYAQAEGTPPSVISQPPASKGRHATREPIPIRTSFNSIHRSAYMLGITAIHRLTTGLKWAEGGGLVCAGQLPVVERRQGQYQYRMLWEDMREVTCTTTFIGSRDTAIHRSTTAATRFDFQGRRSQPRISSPASRALGAR
jgi:hypothetical protein